MPNVRSRFAFVALVALALLLTGTGSPLEAAEKGWKFLGERTVTDGVDHDVIVVTATEGDFTSLQLRVQGHAVQFRGMTVQFGNGESQQVELRDVIPAGGTSRVIDLAGNDRVVKRVEFRYDAQTIRGHRARVRLFGKR